MRVASMEATAPEAAVMRVAISSMAVARSPEGVGDSVPEDSLLTAIAIRSIFWTSCRPIYHHG